jgi:putative membrane protein
MRSTISVRTRRLLQGVWLGYAIFWGWMAIRPLNRTDWLLENLLVFAVVAALAASYRKLPLSGASYLSIALFLTLHTWGSHYSYNATPLGSWLQEWWGLERNPYDRLVHLAYGLLFAYPVWELVCAWIKPSPRWSYGIAVMAILATGAFYELIEMWVVLLAAPELGMLFLGSQGDPWDAHHDMELETLGAAVIMAIAALRHKLSPSSS